MKRAFSAICLIVSILWPSTKQDQAVKTNFRLAVWGMTSAEVVRLEGAEPKTKTKTNDGLDSLIYIGKAGNLDCGYAYYFAEDKLVRGRYIFTAKHSNKNQYLEDYASVKESLIEKYWKPTKDETFWSDNLYRNDPTDWGMAVAVGHLKLQAIWLPRETTIYLQLSGDNFDIHHALHYESTIPEHVELIKKAEEKAKKGIW